MKKLDRKGRLICTCCFIINDPPRYPHSPYLTALADVVIDGDVDRVLRDNLCPRHRRELDNGIAETRKILDRRGV